MTGNVNLPWLRWIGSGDLRAIGNSHAMHDEFLAIERGKSAGPGLKATPSIVDLVCGARSKVHATVFAIEQRRERGSFVVLRLRNDGSGGEAGERFNHQRRSRMRQNFKQIDSGLFGRDLDGLLQEDRSGIEPFLKQHGGVGGVRVAHGHGPLDGRCAAVPGQQRCVQIDAAVPGQREHPRRKNASIRHDDDGLGSDGLKLRAKLRVAADFFRLSYGESRGQRDLLYRRSGDLLRAANGTVGLRDDEGNFMARRKQCLQRGNGELGSAAEDEFHRSTIRLQPAACGFCAD